MCGATSTSRADRWTTRRKRSTTRVALDPRSTEAQLELAGFIAAEVKSTRRFSTRRRRSNDSRTASRHGHRSPKPHRPQGGLSARGKELRQTAAETSREPGVYHDHRLLQPGARGRCRRPARLRARPRARSERHRRVERHSLHGSLDWPVRGRARARSTPAWASRPNIDTAPDGGADLLATRDAGKRKTCSRERSRCHGDLQAYGMLAQMYVNARRLLRPKSTIRTCWLKIPIRLASRRLLGLVCEARDEKRGDQALRDSEFKRDPHAAAAANNLAWLYAQGYAISKSRCSWHCRRSAEILATPGSTTRSAGCTRKRICRAWRFRASSRPSTPARRFLSTTITLA
jgi:hypothetical protein